MRVAPFVALIVPTFLAACASGLENPFTVFADPGQYEFLNCEQLAAQRTARKAREQELKLLMDKTEQSTGGAFVNLIAYKSAQPRSPVSRSQDVSPARRPLINPRIARGDRDSARRYLAGPIPCRGIFRAFSATWVSTTIVRQPI
jgi:hypothetical protein